jgi:hypothetical protein
MKKVATVVFALLLAGGLSLAQTGGSTKPVDTSTTQPADKDTGKKSGTKHHKSHKSGRKSKKSSGSDTAATTPK